MTDLIRNYLNEMFQGAALQFAMPNGCYTGINGHKRLAREMGVALLDFSPADQREIVSCSYGSVYVRATHLKPLMDTKTWFQLMYQGKAEAQKKLLTSHALRAER